MTDCVFCTLEENQFLWQNDHCIVIRDGFPVSPGHTLIIPKRHIPSFFDTNMDIRLALFEALDWAKSQLDEEFSPDDYNIGINDGPVAGQSISHLHIHLIPRYKGDCIDPRGGVRFVLPHLADYWSSRDV